jgi:hypothetical protein
MYTKLRDRIHKFFSMFITHMFRLARQMNLRQVLPGLEKLARKAGLPGPSEATANTIAPNGGLLYVLGCSPTAAGDIVKADERSGKFPNIYPGTLPPDGSSGIFTDNKGDSYTIDPLITSRLMLEHVWDFYQSTALDPIPGWTQDPTGDRVGDSMRSSKDSPSNDDDTKY